MGLSDVVVIGNALRLLGWRETGVGRQTTAKQQEAQNSKLKAQEKLQGSSSNQAG
jgi:hypothetical protein